MRYMEVDFFEDFKCIADKCRHSCCKGWEIDIDQDSLKRYSHVKGAIGQKLRDSISTEGDPCFILSEDERCPFLQDKGLCQLIIELGEDSLCDICREHPRFYNFYNDREERGIGLCCEEAVRLLLHNPKPFKIMQYDSDGEMCEDEAEVILRDRLLEIISHGEGNLSERLISCLELCNGKRNDFDVKFWAEYYLSLERMDEAWTDMLEKLRDGECQNFVPEGHAAERLVSYFVYRHFVNLCFDYGPASALIFCVLSAALIMAIGNIDGENLEHVRLYSSEIEYSDENIQLILDKISKRQK